MPENFITCPECGKRSWSCRCNRRPPVNDYSKLAGNRSPETMRGVVVPLREVTEE